MGSVDDCGGLVREERSMIRRVGIMDIIEAMKECLQVSAISWMMDEGKMTSSFILSDGLLHHSRIWSTLC